VIGGLNGGRSREHPQTQLTNITQMRKRGNPTKKNLLLKPDSREILLKLPAKRVTEETISKRKVKLTQGLNREK